MRCKECSAVIKDDTVKCPYCGHVHEEEIPILNLKNFTKPEEPKEGTIPYGSPREAYHEKGKRGFQAIIDMYKRTFVISGVSDWVEYWTQTLFLIFVTIIHLISGNFTSTDSFNLSLVFFVLYFVSAIIILVSFVPNITASVRRLHDAGHSGLIYLLNFVPIFGSLIVTFLLLGPYNRNEHNNDYEKIPEIHRNTEKEGI